MVVSSMLANRKDIEVQRISKEDQRNEVKMFRLDLLVTLEIITTIRVVRDSLAVDSGESASTLTTSIDAAVTKAPTQPFNLTERCSESYIATLKLSSAFCR